MLVTAAGACAGLTDEHDEDHEVANDDDDHGTVTSNIAIAGAWNPPPDVRAAGAAQFVPYEGPPPWNGGANCGGRLLDGTRELGDFIRSQFAGSVSSYGGYACRQNTANAAQTSVHGTGRAIDLFVPMSGGAADNTKGDAVANFLIRNAQAIGVQYIIWDRSDWSGNQGGDKMGAYTGPNAHIDHIHVELTHDGAARRTPWFRGHGCSVIGAIQAHYNALGGSGGFLGPCLTNETATPDGVGRFNHFRGGSIYWTPATGAHEVHGLIRQRWESMGWELSVLGYPITDETATPDGIGRFNHFQRGSIYWTNATGAQEVHGAIRDKWEAIGWELSPLGYPVTGESTTPDGVGRYNHFQGGSIYWTHLTGAHEVHGLIRAKWEAMGWERSALGYPTSDETGTPDGVGRFNHFQNGSIYYTPATGAMSVQGAIRDRWEALGWELSPLGYPITDETTTPDGIGRYNHFQNGSIYWTNATGAHEVMGAIRNRWEALGWELGPLGYPTSGEQATSCGGGRVSTFQRGNVYRSPVHGAHEVLGAALTRYLAMQAECGTLGFPIAAPVPVTGGGVRYAFEHGALIQSASGTVTVE